MGPRHDQTPVRSNACRTGTKAVALGIQQSEDGCGMERNVCCLSCSQGAENVSVFVKAL